MSTSFLCEIYYILLATGVTTIVYHNIEIGGINSWPGETVIGDK